MSYLLFLWCRPVSSCSVSALCVVDVRKKQAPAVGSWGDNIGGSEESFRLSFTHCKSVSRSAVTR